MTSQEAERMLRLIERLATAADYTWSKGMRADWEWADKFLQKRIVNENRT